MSPAIDLSIQNFGVQDSNNAWLENEDYHKGVQHLCDRGITKVPKNYVLPEVDRPLSDRITNNSSNLIKLPIIDFAQLQGPNRVDVLNSLSKACQDYGFFQLINHGIASEDIQGMIDAGKAFFELPFEERSKYMSKDMSSPVRYGTSFNQNNDKVLCWRDFLKLSCHPLSQVLPYWPSSPQNLKEKAVNYSKETKFLYLNLVEAILESLGLVELGAKNPSSEDEEKDSGTGDGDHMMKNVKEFEDGSQLIVVNCYPSCPEPDVTLGMPPHSDYGFLTLLLQDEVKGLQIQHQGKWVTVDPIPHSFVVNVGDHLEIFSNGRYKSVNHRVLVNSSKSRISIASLHSLPFDTVIRTSPKLIDQHNPKRYKDTDFASFLDFLTSHQHKSKNFLDSRKIAA